MRIGHRVVSAALVVAMGAMACPVMGQAATAPATVQASAAAGVAASSAEAEAKAVVGDLYRAMFAGDPKAFDLMVFTNPADEKKARMMLELALAEQRLRIEVKNVFGESARDFPLGASDEDKAQLEKDLKGATAKVTGDSAEVSTGSGQVFVAILKEGKWKLDFDKTQAKNGPLPKDEEMAGLGVRVDAYNKMAQEIKEDSKLGDAKKYKSMGDVRVRLEKIEEEADAAGAKVVAPPK